MLLVIAIILSVIACIALLLYPSFGIIAIFFARPFVDTAWSEYIFLGFKLTELVSVAVPIIVLVLIIRNFGTSKSIVKMPFAGFWAIYLTYIFSFCLNIAFTSSIIDAANVFFRFANGFAGFYLIQAYYFSNDNKKLFFLALVMAGIFPMGMGLYEFITGVNWKVTISEGQIRNIGLYHDAITIRYYALQTILGIAACYVFYKPRGILPKIALLGMLASALVVLFKAYSKSGLFSLFAWTVIWSYGRRNWVVPILIVIGSIFLIPFYFQEISDAIYNVFHKEIGVIKGDVDMDRSFSGRWIGWQAMMNEWMRLDLSRQLFGAGVLTLGSHNDYLQMLFHGGVIGLILYVYFLIVVGIKLVTFYIKTRNILSVLALMAFVMLLVDTIGLVPSVYTGYQWFVWGVVGLCLRDIKDRKRYARKYGSIRAVKKRSV